MDADLDTLCTVIYCTADDLLPSPRRNARRRITRRRAGHALRRPGDHGHPQRPQVPARCRRQLGHLFPVLPGQSGYHKRRRRLAGAIEWLMGVFASTSPGFRDDLLLVDSTPVPCAASRETVKRSALGEAAGYGYCAAHSRLYWGFRLHLLAAPDGTPRALHARRSTHAANVRSRSSCSRAASARRRASSSATRATPDASSLPERRISACSWCALDARTSPEKVRTWRPSASASRASSGPARTCSRSSATGRAPWPGCASACSCASCVSPPASASTTGWGGRAGHSSTTAPEAAGVESII